ncbi:MAG: thioredoxin domain-containing protein [Acidobacteriota bacterium]
MTTMQRNNLDRESSPYLLQHKDNPVWWQPWGEAAFAEARRRDVPVFLSVGYSTCHWCHVMEHECFEDPEVARALNEGFVAIKVDREERPDVDALYMDAVHAMGRRGGWPMSVWLTPDGRPFVAGTYFPKPQFLDLLAAIRHGWETDRKALLEHAGRVAAVLERSARRQAAGDLDASVLERFAETWKREADRVHGGRRGAPKFPPAWDMRVLLRIWRRTGDAELLEIVRTTLDRLAASGTYDHLGGGFHRYSTDERWLVPHFEKMLYDQASLVRAYLEAWQATGEPEYEAVVRETLDYVLRDMTDAGGGFRSAEDADSEGEEGRFYVWTRGEIAAVLDDEEFAAFEREFTVGITGNFEHGRNVLALRDGKRRNGRSAVVARAMEKLRAARGQRPRPHLDDKVLADWNGLMIGAMARAGRSLGEPRYIAAAARAARFVLDSMRAPDGRLWHRWRDGKAGIAGMLDDYAFMADGLIDLFEATGERSWLEAARDLDERAHGLFADAKTGDLYATDGSDPLLPVRRVEPFDNVVPSGRSVSALNALRLFGLYLDPVYEKRAAALFRTSPALVRTHPTAFAMLATALDWALDDAHEVAVIVPERDGKPTAFERALRREFAPNTVIARATAAEAAAKGALPLVAGRPLAEPGRPTAYVCEHGVCHRPTTDPDTFLELVRRHAPLRERTPPPSATGGPEMAAEGPPD